MEVFRDHSNAQKTQPTPYQDLHDDGDEFFPSSILKWQVKS